MSDYEESTLTAEPNLGGGDASLCLPSWIRAFEKYHSEGNGYTLTASDVSALLHTLYAAKHRAARLVKERNEANSNRVTHDRGAL